MAIMPIMTINIMMLIIIDIAIMSLRRRFLTIKSTAWSLRAQGACCEKVY